MGAPYASPFVFLTLRFFCVLPLLALILYWQQQSFTLPRKTAMHAIITGALVHGVYLAGVFWSIDQGLPAGVTAMIMGVQPLLTGMFSALLLGESISTKQWGALTCGLIGVMLVILPKLGGSMEEIPLYTLPAALIAVVTISCGTAYQKKMPQGTNLIAATTYQYIGALLVLLPLSISENWQVTWSGEFIFALGWLVLVLSIGAVLLLLVLIREGAVSSTARLFYLVPVATTIESYLLFGETLHPIQLLGMCVIMAAILLARPRPIPAPASD